MPGPSRLVRRWVARVALTLWAAWAYQAVAQGQTLALSNAQQRWLALHPDVRFAPHQRLGPFVFEDEAGRIHGLSVDYLEAIVRKTGLRITQLQAAALHEHLDAVKRGSVDLISSLRPTPEYAEHLAFSHPYVTVPAIVVGDPEFTSGRRPRLKDLQGHRIAVSKGYAVEPFVRRRFNRIEWVAVDDDRQALQGVVDGRWAGAVLDLASAQFITRAERFGRLILGEPIGFEYQLSFGYRKDWPELGSVLDQAIRSISNAERQRIMQKWLVASPSLDSNRNPVALGGLGLIAMAVLAASLGKIWRNR